jgi:collagenase-like PrtC family protease
LRRTCQKHQRTAEVELILHGSMILDSSGRALDAELIGNNFPTGNGVEGGEFIAPYSVVP